MESTTLEPKAATSVAAVDRLNSLLRGELAAVATYESALSHLGEKAAPDADQLQHFASEHRRSAVTLKAAISALGGTPSEKAGPWGAFAKLVQGSANLLGDKVALSSLKEGEEHGVAEYQEALANLDPESRAVVEGELIPRQRKHIAALSALLIRLRGDYREDR